MEIGMRERVFESEIWKGEKENDTNVEQKCEKIDMLEREREREREGESGRERGEGGGGWNRETKGERDKRC
jgi:hypothetical protein